MKKFNIFFFQVRDLALKVTHEGVDGKDQYLTSGQVRTIFIQSSGDKAF